MFSGDLDTKTPMTQAQRLLPSLSNARHVVLTNAGHDDLLEMDEEVRARVHAFFAGQAVSASPINLDPIHFSMPSDHEPPCNQEHCSGSPISGSFAGRDTSP
jgi:hypothetical protein